MKKSRLTSILYAFIISNCLVVSQAFASIIFLSGDSNIGNAIDGSGGASINTNNATWFTNILSGGASVTIHADGDASSATSSLTAINNHYNSLGGVSSSIVQGSAIIDGSLLAGVDLFISALPTDSFSSVELNSMSNFLSGGGSLFFMGENSENFSANNSIINSALGSLGSSMSLLSTTLDGGFNTTSNIDPDPFNTGVSNFTYAYTNTVGISGGASLIRTLGGETFIAYEDFAAVPAPAAVWLFGSGLLGLVGMARRKKA